MASFGKVSPASSWLKSYSISLIVKIFPFLDIIKVSLSLTCGDNFMLNFMMISPYYYTDNIQWYLNFKGCNCIYR